MNKQEIILFAAMILYVLTIELRMINKQDNYRRWRDMTSESVEDLYKHFTDEIRILKEAGLKRTQDYKKFQKLCSKLNEADSENEWVSVIEEGTTLRCVSGLGINAISLTETALKARLYTYEHGEGE